MCINNYKKPAIQDPDKHLPWQHGVCLKTSLPFKMFSQFQVSKFGKQMTDCFFVGLFLL